VIERLTRVSTYFNLASSTYHYICVRLMYL